MTERMASAANIVSMCRRLPASVMVQPRPVAVPVPAANSDAYVAGLQKHNIPFVYLRANIGGHGFGITDDWSSAAMAWLKIRKF